MRYVTSAYQHGDAKDAGYQPWHPMHGNLYKKVEFGRWDFGSQGSGNATSFGDNASLLCERGESTRTRRNDAEAIQTTCPEANLVGVVNVYNFARRTLY
ncbi:MAG: hypothetical protein OHK0050_29980 [Roseiflexaceae bacterium]